MACRLKQENLSQRLKEEYKTGRLQPSVHTKDVINILALLFTTSLVHGLQSFGRQDVWATMTSRLGDKSKSLHLGQPQSLGRSRHH